MKSIERRFKILYLLLLEQDDKELLDKADIVAQAIDSNYPKVGQLLTSLEEHIIAKADAANEQFLATQN